MNDSNDVMTERIERAYLSAHVALRDLYIAIGAYEAATGRTVFDGEYYGKIFATDFETVVDNFRDIIREKYDEEDPS